MSDSPATPGAFPDGDAITAAGSSAPPGGHESHFPTLVLRPRDGRHGPDRPFTPIPADLPPPPVPGYEILEEIGRGGTSVVYKARQLSLDRVVAIKMLHAPHACPSDRLARFRAEAEAIARLHHPNIIQVHEVGVAGGGPFFVLEFAGGGSLAGRLDGSPLPDATAAQLCATLARAVQHAHDRGIIHRDLKPGNVLLIEPPGAPLEASTVKVTDFGLARLLDESKHLTHTGQVMGTPGYMPPEQARGPSENVGPPADVYSLGVILYEMLTGRPPHCGGSAIETVQMMLHEEPLPPSRLRRQLPRDLETICLKCLDKEPQRRYGRAADLADDLARWARGEPIVARPTPAWERAWKWARRRPLTAALAASALTLLLLAFVLVFWQWRRAEEQREKAVTLALAEAESRHEAQSLSSRLLLERGAALCEAGEVGPGLLWLINSLEKAPDDADEQRRSLRLLLGGWGSRLHTLDSYHVFEEKPAAALWDGTRVLVACGRDVHLFDPKSRRSASTPVRLPGEVLSLSAGKAGPVVAAVADGKLTLHRADGRALGPAIDVGYRARAATVSADGGVVLIGGDDHFARLHRVADGAPLGKPWPHEGAVRAVALSPDGQWALTGGTDNQARVWSVASGELSKTLKEHKGPIVAAAFSADGKLMLTGGEDRRLALWRANSRNPVFVRRHEREVYAVAFSPDGTLAAAGCDDNTTRVWRVADGTQVGGELRHSDDLAAVCFSPDGRQLATAGRDRTLRVWKVCDPGAASPVLRHPAPLLAVAAHPSGGQVLTTCSDNFVRLWDVERGTHRAVTTTATGMAVAFSPDGKAFLVAQYDGWLRVCDTATLRELCPPMAHCDAVLCAAFSPDGRFIATGCDDNDKTVRLWDWRRGEVVRHFIGHSRKTKSLAFRADGKVLLTASWDYFVRAWDVESGTLLGKPMEHRDLVQSVTLDAGGGLALSGGDDYVARLWDVAKTRERQLPLKHPDKVQSVALTASGLIAAAGGKNGQVRLWDATTGKSLSPPLPHAGEVHSLAFDADGALWSASWDGTARRWAMPTSRRGSAAELRTWVEAQTGQRLDASGGVVALTLEEWRRRVGEMGRR